MRIWFIFAQVYRPDDYVLGSATTRRAERFKVLVTVLVLVL
jgi:hypothetical protein